MSKTQHPLSQFEDLTETGAEFLRKLDRNRRDQERIAEKVNKIHAKLIELEPNKLLSAGAKFWDMMKSFYDRARHLCEEEELLCNLCVRELESCWGLRRSADMEEVKRLRSEMTAMDHTSSPPQVPERPIGEVPGVSSGDRVIVRVFRSTLSKHQREDWVMAKVLKYDTSINRYLVLFPRSVDGVERDEKLRVGPWAIFPFPKANDPASAPELHVGSHVLTTYPGTCKITTGYIASDLSITNTYEVEFAGEVRGSIPFYKVMAVPWLYRRR